MCVNILSRRHCPFDIILKDTSNYYFDIILKDTSNNYLS